MGDLERKGDFEVRIVDTTSQTPAKVDAYGSMQNRLYDASGNLLIGQKAMSSSIPVTISSDQPTLPVSVGLPFYLEKTFGFAVGIDQPLAGSNNPLIYLKNPSGSGKNVYIEFVSYGITVANVLGNMRIYKNPTTTANGTSQTIISLGGGTTAIELYTVPTVTASGSLIDTEVYGQNSTSVMLSVNFAIGILPNETLLITGDPGSNKREAQISIRWIEL